jgi:hypothetical protein
VFCAVLGVTVTLVERSVMQASSSLGVSQGMWDTIEFLPQVTVIAKFTDAGVSYHEEHGPAFHLATAGASLLAVALALVLVGYRNPT